MKGLKCFFASLMFVLPVFAGKEYPDLPQKITDETPSQKEARLSWWVHDRFGMFIHFGLYSVSGHDEWIKSNECLDNKTYDDRFLPRFNPDLYDAKEWVRIAKNAGMKYIVLTVKHHEGFCMWDTKTTNYKITNTDFKRDVVREYVNACREAGLRIGFYFSIIDWHHPDYIIDGSHPLRPKSGKEWTKENLAKLNTGRDWNRYRRYMWDQIDEVLTNYGTVDIVWFDYTVKGKFGKTYKDWDAVNLIRHVRKLQPGILINNRLDLMETDDGWDFITPEQATVQDWPTVRGRKVPWEVCETFSGGWGYFRDEETWKSVPQLLKILINSVSKGGNMLLNVGPTARGEFDWRAQDRLAGIANWMRVNSRSIYGCGVAPEEFKAPNGTALTYNKETKRLYIHLYDYPMGFLPVEFTDKIEYAQFLHDGSELIIRQPPQRHAQDGEQKGELGGIRLPMKKPHVEIPVIEVWLKK